MQSFIVRCLVGKIIYIVFALAIFILLAQAIDDNYRNPPLGKNGGF